MALEIGLELGEGHLDRVEIGAVGGLGRKRSSGPGLVNGAADSSMDRPDFPGGSYV